MPKTPNSMGELMVQASNQLEIDARNQSYAVATEIVKNVITRYGSHESPQLVKYWTEIADGVFAKMNADMKGIVERK